MTNDNKDLQAEQQSSKPNPSLRSLDRLVGTWNMQGHEFDTGKAMDGQVRFEWMNGGFF